MKVGILEPAPQCMGAPQAKKEIPGNACGNLHDLYLDDAAQGPDLGAPKSGLSPTTPPDPIILGLGAADYGHRIRRGMPMS